MNALLTRLGGLVTVLFGISFITFAVTHFAPGDKALAIAQARYPGEMGFDAEILEGIRDEFHLDRPFISQYLHWLVDFLTGDFGRSYSSHSKVWDIFAGNLEETFSLAITALTLGLAAAFLLAGLAVWRKGSLIDRFAILLASVGAAIPSFWLSILLILLFSAHLGWLPAYGTGTLAQLVLPTVTLAFWVMSSQTRLLRSFLLEAYDQPFVETLRLRSVSEREIFFSHVLRHALSPALTMIGLDLAGLIEGAVIVEIIFARSGLGSLLAGSVLARDLPVVVFLVMFFALTYVLINTVIDLVQTFTDPRHLAGERNAV
ncbi:ABC transporter permease [Parasedimentitalea maritima]|uniref:ABC transporter permease n=1 Tax=Parasedimentitalea maritima TaxID=2578117 RepID=A0ABY2UUF9_9RHOB|nr:ABC transporter permease [Zongyanglinia marina]TLP56004.1 ABC transporter permease [Zongyanglinia marina]